MKSLFYSLLFLSFTAQADVWPDLPDEVPVFEMIEEQSDALDGSKMIPLGRAVKNRKTGEMLEFVCLHEFKSPETCHTFQLRENGTKLLGYPFRVYSLPKNEVKEKVMNGVRDHFKAIDDRLISKRWKYRKSWARKLIESTSDYDPEDWPFVVIIFGGGYAAVVGGGIYVMMLSPWFWGIGPAVLVTQSIVPKLFTLTQRSVIEVRRAVVQGRENRMLRRLEKASSHIFDESKVERRALRLKDKNYRMLHSLLTESFNPSP